MHIETLLLDFMARIDDALKGGVGDDEKLEAIRQAKAWADAEYAALAGAYGSRFDGPHSVDAPSGYAP